MSAPRPAGYGQTADGWPGATVSLHVTNGVLGGAVPLIPFAAAGQSFQSVTVTSTSGTNAQLALDFDLQAASLPLSYPATVTVGVADCDPLEEFVGNVCVCKAGSVRAPDGVACTCAEGYHTETRDGVVACRDCSNLRNGVCLQGTLVPLEEYWQPTPESEDIQKCAFGPACSHAGRLKRLQALQSEAQQKAGVSSTGLALAAGTLQLETYLAEQCSPGCVCAFGLVSIGRCLAVLQIPVTSDSSPVRYVLLRSSSGTQVHCAGRAKKAMAALAPRAGSAHRATW